MKEEFHPHETLVARLTNSLGKCVMNLCIETGLIALQHNVIIF